MNLDTKFTLIGHSLGGCISALYALRYPTYIKTLILADPWGISHYPTSGALEDLPYVVRVLRSAVIKINPLSLMRAAGPLGPYLVSCFRRELAQKFLSVYESERTVTEYLYHLNAQTPCGEAAFQLMHNSLRWSREPLIDRLHELDAELPVTILYGDKSWITKETEENISQKVGRKINCLVMANCGHHIYADDHGYFNQIVLNLAKECVQS